MPANIPQQIETYIASQPQSKRDDMQALHRLILKISPKSRLWFFDGKNRENKVVANPAIGYGSHIMKYADGSAKEHFQLDISANTTGISIHIIGLKDKTYLAKTFGKELGKASVTGYCIKFKALKDLNLDTLKAAIQYGFEAQHQK